MALQKVAGSAIYIGNRVEYKTVVTPADFTGQEWKRIGKWIQTGDLGAEQETVTQALIDDNVTLYSKGTLTFPIMQNIFVPTMDDVGQIAFIAAQKSCKPFAFKVEWGADCGEEGIVTISDAAPGVVSWTAHGLPAGTPIRFTTTGALPAPLVAGTVYFVVAPTANAFSVSATVGGTGITTTTAGAGVHTAYAQPVGETDLFYGFAMRGTKTGGDASATRQWNAPIQPISEYITI